MSPEKLAKVYDVQVEGINMRDYPDFVDAYLASGKIDDRELTDAELDDINDNNLDFVYDCVLEELY